MAKVVISHVKQKGMTENNRRKLSTLLHRLANGIAKGECECEDLICDVVKDIIKDDYTRTEAARYLRISERTFDRYRRDGLIGEGKKKAGGLMMWKRSQLDRFIENNKKSHKGG